MIYIIAIALAIMVIFLLVVLSESHKTIISLHRSVDFLKDENKDLQAQLDFVNNLIKKQGR